MIPCSFCFEVFGRSQASKIKPKRYKNVQQKVSILSSKKRVSGNKCSKNDSLRTPKTSHKHQKQEKQLLGNLIYLDAKKEQSKVFFTFLDSFPDSFLGVVFVILFDFRMPFSFFWGVGVQEFRRPFVPFWSYFSIILMKNNIIFITQ